MSHHPPEKSHRIAYIGDGVSLWDVSHLIPRKHPWPKRELESIRQQYVHHSGILRAGDPFEHLCSSARFSIRSRDWPGSGYHLWHPYFDVYDGDGHRVVYLANHPERRTFHAGTAPNDRGLAHCLQGNTSRRPMSEPQRATLPATVRYYAQRLGIPASILGHFQATDGNAKASCPGSTAEAWVRGYQAGRDTQSFPRS